MTRRQANILLSLSAATGLALVVADRDSPEAITAIGDSFSDTLRAAQGLPVPERPPGRRELVAGWLERRRLHTAAINRRMAELERELEAGR